MSVPIEGEHLSKISSDLKHILHRVSSSSDHFDFSRWWKLTCSLQMVHMRLEVPFLISAWKHLTEMAVYTRESFVNYGGREGGNPLC